MAESMFDLLLDPFFLRGVIAGLIVLAVGIIWWSVLDRDGVQGFGGMLVATAVVLVLYESEMLFRSQAVGVILLAIAGLIQRGGATGAFLAIPGAFLVIRPDTEEPLLWLAWFAFFAIVFAGPLVNAFDRRYGSTGISLPLFGIATLGVFLTVPDTEGALVLLGVAGIAGFLGWPRPFASLGAAGSYAVVGVYVRVAAEGAVARPASMIAAVAVLGLLLIVPIAGRLRSSGWAHSLDEIDQLIPLVGQLVFVLLVARTTGRIAGVPIAASLTVVFVAAATTIVMTGPRRPSQLPE